MTDNANTENLKAFRKQKNKEAMKRNLISFALMIVVTLIAFIVVATGAVEAMFAIPIIVFLAIIQVGFQFYYFMHMKDKGHAMPTVLLYGGVWAALLTLAGLVLISWW
ncbi:MAG TPA: cytochrome c oxidase subunit IVB [Bacillota bacterium]|nr:cytochrome c oxidase subunit IVB [Bacillota bacterium]